MREPVRVLLAVSMAAVFLLPAGAFSQGHGLPNVQIQVQVRLADGSAGPRGAAVEVDLENGEFIDQSQTDSSGKCRFSPTTGPAVYVVRVKAAGYLEATNRLDLQNSQSGFANIILRPIPGQTPPSPAAGSVSASGLAVPDGAQKEYEKGQKLLTSKDLDGGISHLKKAIEIYPSFPQALTLLGTAYNEKKNWKDAQGTLEKATTIDPKNASAFFQLGAALNQTKDYPGAQKALSQGLTLAPDAPEASAAQYELARAYMAQNNWKEAEPYAAKVVASQPDFGAGRLLMGNIFLKKGDGNGAIHEFQEYLRIDPKGPAADQIKDMIPKIQAAMKKQS